MNPETKRFEPVTQDTPDNFYQVAVGDKCEINGIKCRIRKITKKDIICRPIDWSQVKVGYDET